MTGRAKKYFGTITDVLPQHALDVARLGAWLDGRLPGRFGGLAIRQFQGGLSNPTYLLSANDRNYVLRRKPPGVLVASAHRLDREFRVLSALHGVGYPVPEPLAYCDDPEVVGTEFYVMRHMAGRIFFDVTMPDLDRETRSRVYDSINATLAALHRFDPGALGLEDFGRTGNYFSRQISRWSKSYEQSRTQDVPAMERLLAWLPTAVPDDQETRLIHGDYSFHNVLIHPTGSQVVAVIDWELSTTGDPLGDLMYHAMEWYRPAAADLRGSLAEIDRASLGIPDLDRYVADYCARAGLTIPENLPFHQAYNLFRVAAIIQGVVARSRTGTAISADAAAQAARVPLLAEAAWRFAQQGGAS
jgi:aminoglycoside phosphotransferase (APT) family kinase protein